MHGRGHHHHVADGSRRYRRDDNADPTNPNPSIVVHVRNLGAKVTEGDLLESLSSFGPIAYATCIPHSRMALVEFEDIEGAKACVNFSHSNQINVAGQAALVNYSTSQCIERMGFESAIPNKVLVLTILNAAYPVDADVIYQISNSQGKVLRVAVLQKPQLVQALVEFDSIESAQKAKHAMNGADIYSGCCTLKVEFAKPDHVRVTRQDKDQRDYTLPDNDHSESGRKTLLPSRPDDRYRRVERDRFDDHDFPPRDYGAPSDMYDRGGYGSPEPRFNRRYEDRGDRGGSSQGGPGCVLMVYGIEHEKINCDMLFNILCQYGNVLRISFMRSKVETGMIEMGKSDERQNVLDFLQGVEIFGLKLEFKPSHQDGVHHLRDPFLLPDGSPSFADFSGSRNQRFSTPEFAAKNRIVFPTNVLHWFNAPGTMDEEAIRRMIADKTTHTPVKIDVFPSRNERSAAGTVEFATTAAANEALALVNHQPVDSPYGSAPFIIKWAYATPRRWDGSSGEQPKSEDDIKREGIQPASRPAPFRRGGRGGGERQFRPESYRGGLHGSGADRYVPYSTRGSYRGGTRGRRGSYDY